MMRPAAGRPSTQAAFRRRAWLTSWCSPAKVRCSAAGSSGWTGRRCHVPGRTANDDACHLHREAHCACKQLRCARRFVRRVVEVPRLLSGHHQRASCHPDRVALVVLSVEREDACGPHQDVVDIGRPGPDRLGVQDQPLRPEPLEQAPDGDLAECPAVPGHTFRAEQAGTKEALQDRAGPQVPRTRAWVKLRIVMRRCSTDEDVQIVLDGLVLDGCKTFCI